MLKFGLIKGLSDPIKPTSEPIKPKETKDAKR